MNLLLYGVIALAILGTVGGIVYKIREGGYDACKVEWNEAITTQREEDVQRSITAAAGLADDRKKRAEGIKTRTVYVDKIVERPVYRNQCFDADGLRCLNAAINGESAAGCKPDGTMPATKPAG